MKTNQVTTVIRTDALYIEQNNSFHKVLDSVRLFETPDKAVDAIGESIKEWQKSFGEDGITVNSEIDATKNGTIEVHFKNKDIITFILQILPIE